MLFYPITTGNVLTETPIVEERPISSDGLALIGQYMPPEAPKIVLGTSTEAIRDFASSTLEGTPLNDLAVCESQRRQFNPDGSVVTHFNKNKSVDLGYLQINSIHDQEALDMGFDLNTPEGNIYFGLWLYRTKGSAPWVCKV